MNIDFHAHILPAADHGCADVKTALQQLTLAKHAGIDLVVAAPHFYPHQESLDDFLARRAKSFQELKAATEGKDLPEVLLGTEVQLRKGLEHLENLEALCIEGTKLLLLELTPGFSIRSYEQTIDDLLYQRGLTIVLAHIDRYATAHTEYLLDCGCFAQLNAEAFCRFRTRRSAMNWSENESVVALGSDLHGTDDGYKQFLKAKKRLGDCYDSLMLRTETLLKEYRVK